MDAGWLRARNMVGSSWRILWRPPFSSNAGSCTSSLVVPSSSEQTKDATAAESGFIGAGFKTEDAAYDIKKGFVKVLGRIPKRKRAQKGVVSGEQKDRDVIRRASRSSKSTRAESARRARAVPCVVRLGRGGWRLSARK